MSFIFYRADLPKNASFLLASSVGRASCTPVYDLPSRRRNLLISHGALLSQSPLLSPSRCRRCGREPGKHWPRRERGGRENEAIRRARCISMRNSLASVCAVFRGRSTLIARTGFLLAPLFSPRFVFFFVWLVGFLSQSVHLINQVSLFTQVKDFHISGQP